ncbi:MAG: MarR family transcriptional regulator [Pseudomonadota bacterium]
MPDAAPDPYFQLIGEAGIITQIATTFLEARLPDGLMVSHFGVINHLIRVRDGATPLELARAFQVPKNTMTYTLGGLRRHRFVEIRPNPEDKRSKQVWLTEAGRRFRAEALRDMAPVIEAMSDRFGRGRVEKMLPDLADFRAMIDRLRDEMS